MGCPLELFFKLVFLSGALFLLAGLLLAVPHPWPVSCSPGSCLECHSSGLEQPPVPGCLEGIDTDILGWPLGFLQV